MDCEGYCIVDIIFKGIKLKDQAAIIVRNETDNYDGIKERIF